MQKPNKKALVIGGTGILGIPLVRQLISGGEYEVHSISLEKASDPHFPPSVHEHVVDRNSQGYESVIGGLNSEIDFWDVVVDLIAFDDVSSRQTYELFKDEARHIISISTSLVYDRSEPSKGPILEDAPLAQEGALGGYVDGKLRLERFWQGITDVNWTIFRPYHVLGEHSLLGCVPERNRDPGLVKAIRKGDALRLCDGGDISFNFIHPRDIATAICETIGKGAAFRQAFNLVNPEIVIAKEYYVEVARQISASIKIEKVPMAQVWEESKGWEMTTLPHVYGMGKLEKAIGFVPQVPLKEGIRDALSHQPKFNMPIEEIPIHKRMNKPPRPQRIDWLVKGREGFLSRLLGKIFRSMCRL
jgi:nucleoside-diphosphate-sugar epimerase